MEMILLYFLLAGLSVFAQETKESIATVQPDEVSSETKTDALNGGSESNPGKENTADFHVLRLLLSLFVTSGLRLHLGKRGLEYANEIATEILNKDTTQKG